MKVATRPETSPAAQDVRRSGVSTTESGSFETALEAQIATAGIARGPSPIAERDLESVSKNRQIATRKKESTKAAEEKLVTRPQESVLGLQSAVQAQMTSAQSTTNAGVPVAESSAQTGNSKGERNMQSGTHAVAKDTAPAESPSGRMSEDSSVQNKEHSAGSGQGQGGNQQQMQQNAAGIAPSQPAAQIGTAASGTSQCANAVTGTQSSDKAAGTGRSSGMTAVDALGALGRKTAFKLEAAERPATKADVENFVAQASKALAAAVKRSGGTMVMRLSPENLGLLKVRIETKDGTLNAKVEASERSARELLTDNVDSLRTALEAHGVRVDKIEIVRMDGLQGTSSFHQPGTGASSSDSGGNSQAEDRRQSTERRDALFENQETSGLMDEPAGIYLHGVELRVDAIA